MKGILGAALLCVAAVAPAHATVVRFDFGGTLTNVLPVGTTKDPAPFAQGASVTGSLLFDLSGLVNVTPGGNGITTAAYTVETAPADDIATSSVFVDGAAFVVDDMPYQRSTLSLFDGLANAPTGVRDSYGLANSGWDQPFVPGGLFTTDAHVRSLQLSWGAFDLDANPAFVNGLDPLQMPDLSLAIAPRGNLQVLTVNGGVATGWVGVFSLTSLQRVEVPEPGTLGLFVAALGLTAVVRKRRAA